MKRAYTVALVVAAVLMLFASLISNAEAADQRYDNYLSIKGGYYYPTERISLDEFSRSDFDRRNGFNGEFGFGKYSLPFFGTEFGVGYFENSRLPGMGGFGRARLKAFPVLLSARFYLPLGPVEPYAEAGIGGYYTKLEIVGNLGGPRAFREWDLGSHLGAGLNINVTDTFYLGFEGRYRKIKPEYAGREVKLDGYTATANLGFRY